DHPFEALGTDEMVMLAVHFARTRRARGEGDRQRDLRIACQGGVDDAALAGPGGRGNDVQGAARGRGDTGRLAAHSMFCTCSRIWSISTFSSTAALDVRLSTDLEPSVLAS